MTLHDLLKNLLERGVSYSVIKDSILSSDDMTELLHFYMENKEKADSPPLHTYWYSGNIQWGQDGFVDAVKNVRNITGCNLLQAKRFMEKAESLNVTYENMLKLSKDLTLEARPQQFIVCYTGWAKSGEGTSEYINAIKYVREVTGAFLKEAKEFIDKQTTLTMDGEQFYKLKDRLDITVA